ENVTSFLAKNGLELPDIKFFIFHPGGMKVLAAYQDALDAEGDFLQTTREVMAAYGNMSGTTVLYVMERFLQQQQQPGYALMASMGPGFSCEMALLKFN
ncbi:MAG: hypothetical protein LUD74_04890, partial [Tannerellaceae bacterium]|nr:hypothetical protein [Tannerellaceae bacterium]